MNYLHRLKWICTIVLMTDFTYGGDSNPNGSKPNIIVIVADDMGINDISYHGSDQIPTPNIDSLAIFGIPLNRYYTAPMCTPSRSSLMTGKYPSNVGMQHYVIPSYEPWGLDPNTKILPEYLRDAGYDTKIIGKWHLGFFRKKYTPTFRGFNSHYGYIGPYIDYYNHTLTDPKVSVGYDMRKNLTIDYESRGIYATDLFTNIAVQTIHDHDQSKPLFLYLPHLSPHSGNDDDPLQAPPEEIEKFSYIKDENRRKYAAMVSRLDTGIGKVIRALKDANMLTNSVVLFFSDNGAPSIGMHSNYGSNYPFKGQKDSPWEGAARTAAAIWSLNLTQRQTPSNQLIHVSDWLPTFAYLAGIEINETIDGHNVWNALENGSKSPRNEVLLNADNLIPYASLVYGDWKAVKGTTYLGKYDDWYGYVNKTERYAGFDNYGSMILKSDAGMVLSAYSYNKENDVNSPISLVEIKNLRKSGQYSCNGIQESSNPLHKCHPIAKPCLFNIIDDPCERVNLASERPDVLDNLLDRIKYFEKIALPPRNRPIDIRCNPANFNYTWTWWFDELHIPEHSVSNQLNYKFSVIGLGLILLNFVNGSF